MINKNIVIKISKLKILFTLITVAAVGQIPLFSIEAQGRPQSVILSVPYASQIPTGKWNDPRQADGCEEASILMAMAWVNGAKDNEGLPPDEVERNIINLAEYEKVIYGFHQDTSAQDTARVMREFFRYDNIAVRENISVEDIKLELAANRLVIIPLNVQATGLPMYRGGPVRHTIVVVGYDDKNDELIIHDPLYKNIQNFWVPASAIGKGLSNYHSGIRRSGNTGTALISVGRTSIMNE